MLIGRLGQRALVAAVGMVLAGGATGADQRRFAPPGAALPVLVDTLEAAEPAAIAELFGGEHLGALLGDDPASARADLREVHAAATEVAALRPDGPDRFTVVIGRVAWPMPIPLVHDP